MNKPDIDLIFEVSWEVCNKIGGIYTVLSSKSYMLHKTYGDNIIFIGPDFHNDAQEIFIPDSSVLSSIDEFIPADIKVRKGRWNVPGKPIALLIDFSGGYKDLNRNYGSMWELYKVDSLHAYGDYDEACAFSITAARLIESLYRNLKKKYKKVIAHFNEWTTGMGLLFLKAHCPQIATIFTTHATSIGRSICGNNKPLYGYLRGYDGDQMADELNMQSKHSLEKNAALNADCFTTVSEITAKECEQLLTLRPHIVTPNGFEKEISGTKVERSAKRLRARKKIFKILEVLTGKQFDDDTLIIATSGRNEYKNKGIDVYLDALASLRERNLGKKILGLVLVPGWTKEPRTDLLAKIHGDERLFLPTPYITHWLNNPGEDAIYNRIAQLNFNVNREENITVVYIPCYLNGYDGVFNLNYYDFLPAVDLTVFPSYYEPWGYTPLESIAFGVPTITTSLSGFGQWIISDFPEKDFSQTGVDVVERTDFNYHDVIKAIADRISYFTKLNKRQRKEISDASVKTAAFAEWENFIRFYIESYQIALKNISRRLNKKNQSKKNKK